MGKMAGFRAPYFHSERYQTLLLFRFRQMAFVKWGKLGVGWRLSLENHPIEDWSCLQDWKTYTSSYSKHRDVHNTNYFAARSHFSLLVISILYALLLFDCHHVTNIPRYYV